MIVEEAIDLAVAVVTAGAMSYKFGGIGLVIVTVCVAVAVMAFRAWRGHHRSGQDSSG